MPRRVPLARLADELARIGPAECLIAEDDDELPTATRRSGTMLTRRPAWAFALDNATSDADQALSDRHARRLWLRRATTPLPCGPPARCSTTCARRRRPSLDHIDRLTPYRAGELLEIDEATRRSLEITRTIRTGSREGSLLAVIDQTVTPLGSRLLADWLANPLTSSAAINARLDAVGELAADGGAAGSAARRSCAASMTWSGCWPASPPAGPARAICRSSGGRWPSCRK